MEQSFYNGWATHLKWTEGARPPQHFILAYQHFCHWFSEGYNNGGGKTHFWKKKVPKSKGYDCKWGTTWRMKGYKYTPPTHGLDKHGVSKFNFNSQSNGWERVRGSDVNPTVKDRRNNSLNPRKLKQPPSRRETCKQKWRLHLEPKYRLRRMRDIMAETLKTPKDTHSINYAMVAQEYKFKLERSQPRYSIQVLEKRPRHWG